ncbi:hypothetical protein BaRGS_00032233 [Batillaria attramentaria]|uniref:Uncharacterized protein n=1 Tax=Batillaria attramentaria TaxID=370345 RepID=A0ABD0JP26_9CAEN
MSRLSSCVTIYVTFWKKISTFFWPFVESNTNFLSSVQDLRREGRWSSDVAEGKQGLFSTPPDKKLFRETIRPDQRRGKKNVRKTLKLQGKSHVSQSGKVVSEKKVSSVDCSKCRFGFKDITGEDRKATFDIF